MIAKTLPESTKESSTGRIIKIIILGLASGLTYFWIFYYAFGLGTLRTSLLFVLAFFVCFHLFYIPISKISIRYLAGALLILSIVEWVSIWRSHYLIGAGICVINAGIWTLAYHLQDETQNKIKFNSRSYFNIGWYIFTVFITIGYSLLLLWFYPKFPRSCQDLSNASNRVVDAFTQPVTNGAKKITINTQNFRNTRVSDIISAGKTVSLQTTKTSQSPLIQTINTWKKNLIDQALQDNNTVSMGICDYLLTAVNKIYDKPAFLTSIVILLFLLLYGFVRIVFYVMSFLWFIIFQILKLMGVYKKIRIMKEVTEIE